MDDPNPDRLELANRVEAADLATREGRVVAVRALLVGLLRGQVSASEAKAGASLLSVVVVDHPAEQGNGSDLLAGLLAAARRSREELAALEARNNVIASTSGAWGRLVTEHPEPAPILEELPRQQRQ